MSEIPWRIQKRYLDGTWSINVVEDAKGEDVDFDEHIETIVPIVNAVAALSPSVRDLLLRNPQAVELAVKAVEATSAYHEHSRTSQYAEGWMNAELDLRCTAHEVR